MRYILGSSAGEGGGSRILLGMMEAAQSRMIGNYLHTGEVFFDIGANVGYYTLLGSRLVGPLGRVVAIEPSPRNIAFLWRHVELNRLSNVGVIACACGRSIGLSKFASGDNCAVGHLGDGDSVVPVVSVDRITNQMGMAPDVIKIDVEGAELEVLEGSVATISMLKPAIFLSLHSTEMRSRCLSFLRDSGYTVAPIDADSIESATEIVAIGHLPEGC